MSVNVLMMQSVDFSGSFLFLPQSIALKRGISALMFKIEKVVRLGHTLRNVKVFSLEPHTSHWDEAFGTHFLALKIAF